MTEIQATELQATIHQEDGTYWAEVPELPGLFASGDTLDELVEALVEAYVIYMSGEDVAHVELELDRVPKHPVLAQIKLRVPA